MNNKIIKPTVGMIVLYREQKCNSIYIAVGKISSILNNVLTINWKDIGNEFYTLNYFQDMIRTNSIIVTLSSDQIVCRNIEL